MGERIIRVTNSDKILFPEPGISKLELVEYFVSVGEGILRAVRERPTYLKRHPDGVEGEGIYTKRVPSFAPDWIQTVRVDFPSGRHADAIKPTEVATIAWCANLATLDFHPWHTRARDVDHPDELRIDLDPQPGTDFDDARRICLEVVAPLLEELGFRGFVKTSGNRGLHVYIRILPRWTFTEVRRAALAFARAVERAVPDQATAEWWKENRGTRVFVDFNQNARDRTIASSYSVRAQPQAQVSAPISWEELTSADPDDFTVRTMPSRFAELGDLHREIDDVSFDLAPLLEWSDRDERDKGLGDAPYPPQYPKMPGEPMRVQPSRAKSKGN